MANFRPLVPDPTTTTPPVAAHVVAYPEDGQAVARYLRAVTDAHRQLMAELTPEGRAVLDPPSWPPLPEGL